MVCPFSHQIFPDCKAYSSFRHNVALQPKDLSEFPFHLHGIVSTSHVLLERVPIKSLQAMGCIMYGVEISSYGGHGILARTSDSLITFLESDNLLLFPHKTSKPNTNLMKTLQEDDTKVRAQIHQSSNKLCLVRVLLHDFKEGSFQEGAVVCAPTLADISLLKSR
ncbi:unnamed protein product [Arabidopsis halleri]